MSDERLFAVYYSKPEWLRRLIARHSDPNEFLDIDYTRAVSPKQAVSRIKWRWKDEGYPDRIIDHVESLDPEWNEISIYEDKSGNYIM